MSMFENLWSRLGRNKIDPQQREMTLHARAAAPTQLPPALALPELMERPRARVARGSTPPPIPPRRRKRHGSRC